MVTFDKIMFLICITIYLFLWSKGYNFEALASLMFAVIFKLDCIIDRKNEDN